MGCDSKREERTPTSKVMMDKIYTCLLFAFLVVVLYPITSTCKLTKVAVVHRHGDRAPYEPISPKDPFQDLKDWPEGWRQLTMKGKRNMYSLGRWLGKRYPIEDHRDVSVMSSGTERCILSVQCLLTGAFPPTNDNQTIAPGLAWRPFFIKINDSMLAESAPCPAYDNERKSIYGTKRAEQDFDREHLHLYNNIAEITQSSRSDSDAAISVYARLLLAEKIGLKLPSYATQKFMQQMEKVAIMDYYFRGMTFKQKRLKTGMLFEDIVSKLESSKEKIHIYSTHDVEISIMMNSMGLFNHSQLIDFGATLIFELHDSDYQTSDNQYIKIFYMNQAESKVVVEVVPQGCQGFRNCPLSQFKGSIEKFFVSNWKQECNQIDNASSFLDDASLTNVTTVY